MIFDVTRCTPFIVFLLINANTMLELMEDLSERFAQDVAQNIETTAVGHANNNILDSQV